MSVGFSHTCALTTKGEVECWGSDEQGEVSETPTSGTYAQLSVNSMRGCVLDDAGALTCWGSDDYDTIFGAPAGPFAMVSAGGGHVCALDDDGQVVCWGDDSVGLVSGAPWGLRGRAAGAEVGCRRPSAGEGVSWCSDPRTDVTLIQRILLAVTQLSLLLPFLVVADCGGENEVGYTGLQVYDRLDELVMFVGMPAVVAVVLFAWVWRPGRRAGGVVPGMGSTAPGLSLRAALCGGALFAVVMGPSLAHLFHHVRPRIGWLLQGSAWALLYLGFLGGALRSIWRKEDGDTAPPETWGAVALVLLAPLIAAAVTASLGRNAWAGPLGLGAVGGVPLAAAVLGIGRRRLGGRWQGLAFGLVGLWMLLCGSAALG